MCCVSDEDLVNRWKVSRDQEAFAEIERRYHDRLFGSAYNALLCYEDAEETAQDTLLRVYQKIDVFNPRKASFGTWIYAIHRNIVIDSLRKINSGKRRQDSIEEILSILAPRRPMSPDKIVELKEKNRAFWECKSELSGEEREIFWLKYEEGFSIDEIKEIMRMSKRTTERRWRTARSKMKACMICKGYVVASLFHEVDFKDPAGLAVKLRDAKDPLSQYLREQFSKETQRLLDEYDDGSTPPSESLQRALINELNRLLKGDCLYDKQRFAQVKLTEETQILIERKPQGEALIYLNRSLLEEAYQDEIAKSRFFDDP